MFADILKSATSPKYTDNAPIPKLELLAFEKDVLGLYVSDHPAFEWKKQLGRDYLPITTVESTPVKQMVTVLGLIIEVKKIRTKKGEPMAFVKIQDETSVISCTIFPQQFSQFEKAIEEKAIISVTGTVEVRNQHYQLLVKQIEQHQ